jgi:hypothetical protein
VEETTKRRRHGKHREIKNILSRKITNENVPGTIIVTIINKTVLLVKQTNLDDDAMSNSRHFIHKLTPHDPLIHHVKI